jgi:hypothetical protein
LENARETEELRAGEPVETGASELTSRGAHSLAASVAYPSPAEVD